MNESSEELIHQAQLLIALVGDKEAQQSYLLKLRKELRRRGQGSERLFCRIEALCVDECHDSADYRCCYQSLAEQNEPSAEASWALAQRVFDLSH